VARALGATRDTHRPVVCRLGDFPWSLTRARRGSGAKIAQIQRADIVAPRGGATLDERDAARGVDAGFRRGRWDEHGIAQERATDGVDCG